MVNNPAGFVDSDGKKWVLSLTVGDLVKVKNQTGIQLAEVLQKPEAFGELVCADPERVVRVFWLLCEQQSSGITFEQFLNRFTPETLENAIDGLLAAMVDFFPRRGVRKVLKANLPEILTEVSRQEEEAATEVIKAHLAASRQSKS